MTSAIELDLGAIRRNTVRLRSLVAPARLLVVVKGNAYGHGAVRVARAVAPFADAIGVYSLQEALELRTAGVSSPLVILGAVAPDELSDALRIQAAIPVWTTGSYLADLERTARAASSPFTIHAKIDTGLARFGFSSLSATSSIAALRENPTLRLTGVFTHFAAAEEMNSAYTKQQLSRFLNALLPLEERRMLSGVVRHAAASASAILSPRTRLDMVRCGIAVYGLWPSAGTREAAQDSIELEPALSYRSHIVAIREVPAGQSVGYGCTFITKHPSIIGIVPLGYAEGIPRALSNRGSMLVGGHVAPIIGRICMNTTFIDVSEIPEAHPGARVTLLGRDGEASISADDWATWARTINYEIVTRLPREIPRVYVDSTRPRATQLATAGVQ